jgi:hypothetical protein
MLKCLIVLLFSMLALARGCLLFVSYSVRLESSFRSFSRPVLHAAARVVQEMGKSRAAAYALGAYDEGANLQAYSDNADSLDSDLNENSQPEGTRMLS